MWLDTDEKDNAINYWIDTVGNCENDLRTKIIYIIIYYE